MVNNHHFHKKYLYLKYLKRIKYQFENFNNFKFHFMSFLLI
jgi:hypothetical protein